MLEILTIINKVYGFIKNYKFIAVIAYAVIATLVIGVFVYKMSDLKEDNNRLSTNQEALVQQIDTFKTKSGKDAARITELTLTKGEFEKLCEEQANTIKDLRLKVKRVESISTAATKTILDLQAQLKDTVIIRDTITMKPDTVKVFEWMDEWTTISGIINKQTIECHYESVDTINIVATRVPKKFLCFKWGCKYIEVDATNTNPHSKIVYLKSVKIK